MATSYTIKQIAQLLKISEYAVKKLIKDNKIKAFNFGNHYRINEISLNVFMGHSIHDCINKDEFEEAYNDFNKLQNGKIDKGKFYEYYCSLFVPGTELDHDYYIIKEHSTSELNDDIITTSKNDINKTIENDQVILTKTDITEILKALNNIQQILEGKLK
ncbi:helix-turn-helix domain-containing protein [Clostridium sp. JS66]|uniref:helix-turn-helix domain-containing protein n=1 Tax=Clostridium sp. JS66 TaxID=3064705 RepID=UPI00298DBA1E|nr:helix-turn-helix domain-containing protein [Clostridium sp. JS66]WPC42791.1 helix-turn-helix domain-containing protein [Clostridium sp. JS66]